MEVSNNSAFYMQSEYAYDRAKLFLFFSGFHLSVHLSDTNEAKQFCPWVKNK